MYVIKKAIALIALTITLGQLGACAVMSKTDCLTADWRQIGYGVGLDGKLDKKEAFNVRQQACSKHGANPVWEQFEQGHADGIVEFCQLVNAVELGARGAHHAIDNRVCSERDYPGFGEAFSVGYRLHSLTRRVNESNSIITDLSNQVHRYEKSIRRINQQISTQGSNESNLNQLKSERRNLRNRIYQLERDAEQYRRRLYDDLSARDSYSDYVYQDYITALSDRFVDPRRDKKLNRSKRPQSSFEDRVDEILNQ